MLNEVTIDENILLKNCVLYIVLEGLSGIKCRIYVSGIYFWTVLVLPAKILWALLLTKRWLAIVIRNTMYLCFDVPALFFDYFFTFLSTFSSYLHVADVCFRPLYICALSYFWYFYHAWMPHSWHSRLPPYWRYLDVMFQTPLYICVLTFSLFSTCFSIVLVCPNVSFNVLYNQF